jgi:L-asparaginase II
MQRLGERVFCKVGAEGMFCAALPEQGLGVAIKIDDGNNARAAEVAMAAVIEARVRLSDDERAFIRSLSDVALKNWNGIHVGQLRATAALREALTRPAS